MAPPRKPPGPAPAKPSASSRPLRPRPSMTRTQSLAISSSLYGRNRPGQVASPAASSAATRSDSRTRSPGQNSNMKRTQRESETPPAPGEETNIRVVVRCRGRNDREVRENSGVVLKTDGVKGTSVELSMGPSALSNKTYHFDKVFSPAADQHMIYDDVVKPMVNEMLTGYNCTIFAYGQTGTGKTYTMSGDMTDTLGLVSDSAGIIPRVLDSLFRKLEADEVESSVKCSFIELYNEELRDLLSVEENAKLKIYDDNNSKKGHGSTMVQGVEESHIKNAADGVKLLEDGSLKRQVAATKCNDLSSRSHTVFTVTVYIKRTTEGGEDYVSAGKLNLVDLAGSENIQRSGAENKRAAEAGLINKSLLTLGRVINALVDKSSHIPYRESKLTRLLQDSLGGRTKTCIIATVSPAKSNLEETISTLDYAFRAKNIRNKPQVNQMISKKTVLREYTEEIEKLKTELIATRQRNGVYMTTEAFEQMSGENESRRILSEEQRTKIEMMENNLRNKVHELFALTTNFSSLKKENDGTKLVLDNTKALLEKTESVLAMTRAELAEETTLREAHQMTEEELKLVGSQLLTTIGRTVEDVGGLHSKLDREAVLFQVNRNRWRDSQAQVATVTETVEARLAEFQAQQGSLAASLSTKMDRFVSEELQKLAASQAFLQQQVQSLEGSEQEVCAQTVQTRDDMNEVLEEIKVLREDVKQRVGEGLNGLSAAAARISAEVVGELASFHTQLHDSYSSLGQSFRTIFEDMTSHTQAQKAEADALRRELSAASAIAMAASAAASAKLEAVLTEEREQASTDRAHLLAQIGNLIHASGEAQDVRLTSKIQAVEQDVLASKATFEAAQTRSDRSMDVWCQKEDSVVDDLTRSRDTLKTMLKQNWTHAADRTSSIQETTKAIHAETVQIVDTQMKDISHQMQALDSFVTRAREQNGLHHQTHIMSLQGLSSTVHSCFDNVSAEFGRTYGRIEMIGDHVSSAAATFQAGLEPLDPTVRQPLSSLREELVETDMQEYVPTGTTPPKKAYAYPTVLPRTTLNKNGKRPASPLFGASTTTVNASLVPLPPSGDSSPSLERTESPSKHPVFSDPTITGSVAIADEELLPQPEKLREININETQQAAHQAEPPMKRARRGQGRLKVGLRGGG